MKIETLHEIGEEVYFYSQSENFKDTFAYGVGKGIIESIKLDLDNGFNKEKYLYIVSFNVKKENKVSLDLKEGWIITKEEALKTFENFAFSKIKMLEKEIEETKKTLFV